MQSLLLAVALLGIPLVSWLSRWVVPMGDNGWRWVFVAGGSGLIVALVATRLLPESVRWIEQNPGVTVDARSAEIVDAIERQSVHITGAELPAWSPRRQFQPVPPATWCAVAISSGQSSCL